MPRCTGLTKSQAVLLFIPSPKATGLKAGINESKNQSYSFSHCVKEIAAVRKFLDDHSDDAARARTCYRRAGKNSGDK